MELPSAADYSQAIQNPSICFQDPELMSGTPLADKLGLPKVISGNYASVFPIKCNSKIFAVRCFTKNILDQKRRYEQIDAYLRQVNLPYFVEFKYLENGIRIRNNWLPILKMEWIDGVTLNKYLYQIRESPHSIRQIAEDFLEMANELDKHSIAHGDLQHGNILILDSKIKLVDYDGIFVPALEGSASNERGHANYQHPNRKAHFNKELDKFSVWIIYTSLRALAVDESLRAQLRPDTEQLLFSERDYREPHSSSAFRLLASHDNAEVCQLCTGLQSLLNQNLELIPLPTASGQNSISEEKCEEDKANWIQYYLKEHKDETVEQTGNKNIKTADWLSQLRDFFSRREKNPPTIKNVNLVISSIPQHVKVYINGDYCGKTPLSKGWPSKAPIEIVCVLDGYRKWKEIIHLDDNIESVSINATMILESVRQMRTQSLNIPGNLTVRSNPWNAEIYLDGVRQGIAPEILSNVSSGPHTISLVLQGYETFEKKVTLQPGETLIIDGTLSKKSSGRPQKPNLGSVYATSTPEGATVLLNGALIGTTPLGILDVSAGTHTIKFTHPNHKDAEEYFTLHPGKKITIRKNLIPKVTTGTLTVRSNPVNAEIYLDEVRQGITPEVLSIIPSGLHTISLILQGYETLEKKITLQPGEILTVDGALIRKRTPTGSLAVTSAPLGATVHLDGKSKGTTPLILDGITVGSYTVSISHQHYKTLEKTVEIFADQKSWITEPLVRKKKFGILELTSNPTGSEICLDGKIIGRTPEIVPNISVGSHTITFTHQGHEISEKKFRLNPEQTLKIHQNLIPIPQVGILDVTSDPAGAELLLDKKNIGYTPIIIPRIPAGDHRIAIIHQEYEKFEQKISIKSGQTLIISQRLIRKPFVGLLEVTSLPPGADILIDGTAKGLTLPNTPLIIPDIPAGEHTITFSGTDCPIFEMQFNLMPGQTLRLSPSLSTRQSVGRLDVDSNPNGADCWIDGEYRGRTPQTFSIFTKGRHEIRCVLFGRETRSYFLDIPGSTDFVMFDFQKKRKY
jgi:hypothetical protein